MANLRSIIATTALIATPQACSAPTSPGLAYAYELSGKWCNTEQPQVCLAVMQPDEFNAPRQVTSTPATATAHYVLQVGQCFETGSLIGSLKFDPDTHSRICLPGFTYGPYSAQTTFTPAGLSLSNINQSDGSRVSTAGDLELEWQL